MCVFISKLAQCRHRKLWPRMRLRCAVELIGLSSFRNLWNTPIYTSDFHQYCNNSYSIVLVNLMQRLSDNCALLTAFDMANLSVNFSWTHGSINMEFVTMTTMFPNSLSESNDAIMETTQQQLHLCKQAVCSNKYCKMWNWRHSLRAKPL